MSLRTAAWLAWGLWGLAVSLSGLALALQIVNLSSGTATPVLTSLSTALLTVALLAFPTVAYPHGAGALWPGFSWPS